MVLSGRCLDNGWPFGYWVVFTSVLPPVSDDDLIVGVIEYVGSESGLDLDIFGGGEFAGEFFAVADDPGVLVFFLDDGVFPATAAA